MKKLSHLILVIILSCLTTTLLAQNTNTNKFRQLKQQLATPNNYRTASGAPGHEYWQQNADYIIDIKLDDKNQRVYGTETIIYYNNSPDKLDYIWIQLDQNIRKKTSDNLATITSGPEDDMFLSELKKLHYNFDGGFKLDFVQDEEGNNLEYIVNKTMMRINLPDQLNPGEKYSLKIKWWYNVQDRIKLDGRSGYEYFPRDDNYLYTIAQFYPRMAVYNDVEGWQNKQFLGEGEFTLPFGNFEVNITVPADHIISATGLLQNQAEVLTNHQVKLLDSAKAATWPVVIVNQNEAEEKEKQRSTEFKTWKFKAENVRDFAFASSRKFIWDAMGVKLGERTVMAMSFYPKEGNPLWEELSTEVVAHTIKTYSRFTFDYPYPVAQSVHTYDIGMEYPMISFNGGRPDENGSFFFFERDQMISVIIHEVGHNFFPMIVNSDERQWTWMDEGINSFVQYLAEQEYREGFPSMAGPPENVTYYMRGSKSSLMPIMTNSESIYQFGNNAYLKPATALNILRETILGHELFDYAFKQYANRWKFKHPTPADFFRTMEDASGTDLDWFWRGWFYTTDNVDIAIDSLRIFKVGSKREEKLENKTHDGQPDPYGILILSQDEYEQYFADLFIDRDGFNISEFYYNKINFVNLGGLVMPIIIQFDYDDGSNEIVRIPAEIWRKNSELVSKIFVTKKKTVNIILDPLRETSDVDVSNNYWPSQKQKTKFQQFKDNKSGTKFNE